MGEVVGRDAERAAAWRALEAPGPVVIEGPVGIGKTALLRAVLAEAGRQGWRVLACAPTEQETALPYAALADLLHPLAADLPALPGPQRVAAEQVLLSADPGTGVDERAVGAATRTLLEAAGQDGTQVLVAVDDAPWLDPPSERALRFALRRTPRLAVLVAHRTAGPGAAGGTVPLGLDGLPTGRLARVELEPLGTGALHHIVRARLGRTLSRAVLARIVRDTGGNPLLAIEVARAVLRLPRPPLPHDDLPTASSIQQLVAGTLAGLPPPTLEAIRLAALLTVPRLADLARAGVAPEVLEPAEEAGLLAVAREAVRFAHPAYAAAVRAAVPPGVRRRLHRALAGAVASPDERARHLARATVEPDGTVAAELAEAAARQRARGGPDAAADLYQRAAELAPPDAPAQRDAWRLAAARCRLDSGDYQAAAAAAEALAARATGDLRAEALLLRAMVAWLGEATAGVATIAAKALAAARPGSVLAGRIHAHLASFEDAPEPGRRHAEAAVALLSGHDDERELLSSALLLQLYNEVRAGLPARTELLERALALEGDQPSWLAGTIPAIWWKGIDAHHAARARLEAMLRSARDRGDEPWQLEVLTHLGETELLAGRWAEAERHIAAALELGTGSGHAGERWLADMLYAYRGDLDRAGRAAQDGLRVAERRADAWYRRIYLHLTGFVALCAGRMPEAAAAYTELAARSDRVGLVEPLSLRFEPDWIEACVGAGDLDTAARALARLEERHRRLPRPWTALGMARSRVLMASAAGADPVVELAQLAATRSALPPDTLPLDQARCLMIAGMAHRRARRKRPAREALTSAQRAFTALGAGAFADRAAAELGRIGGRPPAPSGLTATERLVARLAADGRTNQAIADELFLSPKTVEANLTRVYRKLGISRRVQLAAALAGAAAGNPDPGNDGAAARVPR